MALAEALVGWVGNRFMDGPGQGVRDYELPSDPQSMRLAAK
jgi:hypothetical protein